MGLEALCIWVVHLSVRVVSSLCAFVCACSTWVEAFPNWLAIDFRLLLLLSCYCPGWHQRADMKEATPYVWSLVVYEERPLVVVGTSSFLWCFGTVAWVTEKTSGPQNLCRLSTEVLYWKK